MLEDDGEIVWYQAIDSDLVNRLPELMQITRKKIKQREIEIYNKMIWNKVSTKKLYDWENVFETIRKKVDVAQVMLQFVPERPLKKDNKNFSKKWKSWNNSYFVDRENNIIIRNWSTFLAWSKEWLNPIDLVEEYTGLQWKELLDWFVQKKFISINK